MCNPAQRLIRLRQREFVSFRTQTCPAASAEAHSRLRPFVSQVVQLALGHEMSLWCYLEDATGTPWREDREHKMKARRLGAQVRVSAA